MVKFVFWLMDEAWSFREVSSSFLTFYHMNFFFGYWRGEVKEMMFCSHFQSNILVYASANKY